MSNLSKFKMNLSKAQETLTNLKNGTEGKSTNFAKLPVGKHEIRVVPSLANPQWPFYKLFFHYKINGKTLLSPLTFGEKDPIQEFAFELYNSKIESQMEFAKKLFAKDRYYTPIIIRDENSTELPQVKWWAFSKTVYQELMEYVNDPEYGDISDIYDGYDLVVTVQSAKETGTGFEKTTLRPRKTSSKMLQSDADMEKVISTQVDLMSLFQKLSFDELKSELEKMLDGAVSTDGVKQTTQDDENWVDKHFPENPEPKKTEVKVEQKQAPKANTGNASEQFKKLFNEK